MSSPSTPEPPTPATWGLAAWMVVVHAVTSVVGAHRAGIPIWEAFFLPRSGAFRELVGGQHRRLVRHGEPERVLTSVFLHVDLLHLAVNTAAIVMLGRLLEPRIGPWRLLAAFTWCGVTGSLASHNWGPKLSDGASGGAFGLLGMLCTIGWLARDTLDPEDRLLYTRWIPGFAILNLVLSVAVPFVDLSAHLGGLVLGLILGAIPRNRWTDGLDIAMLMGAILWVIL